MISEVEFHIGLDDPLAHACRLLRKAARQGLRVCVATPRHELLSARLWSLEEHEFLAHAKPGASSSVWRRSPIWLIEDFGQAPAEPCPAVWVSVGAPLPAMPSLAVCERLVELVGSSPEATAAGRDRWRHYRQQGLVPVKRFDGAAGQPA